MQTHHANSPGRGVAVMASREVLRICRRCWAGHVSRGYPRRSRSRPRSRSRSRSPRGRVVNLVAFSGIRARDQIKSDQISSLAGHFTSPGHSSFFFFQNSFHVSSTGRKQSKRASATASSSNSAASLRIGSLLLESSPLPK